MVCVAVAISRYYDTGGEVRTYVMPTAERANTGKATVCGVTISRESTTVLLTITDTYWFFHSPQRINLCANGELYSPIEIEALHTVPEGTEPVSHIMAQMFKLSYPPLPLGTDTISVLDIWTGLEFTNIEGLALKNGSATEIESKTIATEIHTWTCDKIEIRDDATILTKTCREKPDAGDTEIRSMPEEFIEDADTGDRYYLIQSSIGISPSRTALMEETSMTFTESYPALPPTVRRINISNGSGKYFARNLTVIR